MLDGTNMFTEQPTLIGHIDTNSGSLLMSDGTWESTLPKTTEDRICVDLGVVGKIPVYAVTHENKRMILLQIDKIEPYNHDEKVEIQDPVAITESKKEDKVAP